MANRFAPRQQRHHPACRPQRRFVGQRPGANFVVNFLLLGEGESQRSGRRRPSLLASSFEALAGALYMDLGFEPVRAWLVDLAAPDLALEAPVLSLKSPKSRLQEYTQRQLGNRPEYRLLEATGDAVVLCPNYGTDTLKDA